MSYVDKVDDKLWTELVNTREFDKEKCDAHVVFKCADNFTLDMLRHDCNNHGKEVESAQLLEQGADLISRTLSYLMKKGFSRKQISEKIIEVTRVRRRELIDKGKGE